MNKTLSLGLILIIATSYAIIVVATPANVVALIQSRPIAYSNANMDYVSVIYFK
jgi:hypothetical protein